MTASQMWFWLEAIQYERDLQSKAFERSQEGDEKVGTLEDLVNVLPHAESPKRLSDR